MVKGWITQNITDPEQSYYMAITIDAVRAVDWVLTQPEVNKRKIAVVGGSQGGGLALITTALNRNVSMCVAHIPNMCHMDYGILHSSSSLTEAAALIKRFPELLEPVLHSLAHFDMMNLAHRLQVPVRVSVGLKDNICMPESVFAAYNRIDPALKHIDIQPFSGHEVSDRLSAQHIQALCDWARQTD